MTNYTVKKYLTVIRDSDAGIQNDRAFEVYRLDFGTKGAKVRFLSFDGRIYIAATEEALNRCAGIL